MLKKLWNRLINPRICTLIRVNADAVYKENRSQLIVLSILGTSLMAGVYLMTFLFPYMRVMRECYSPFLILYLVNFVMALTLAKKSRIWMYICVYAILITTMSFGVVLGVFRNPTNNANLFMVFLIAVPLMFIERPFVILVSTFVCCIAFSVMTYLVKAPAQYQTDLTNCWVCFFISAVTARAMTNARISSIEARRQLFNESLTDPLTGLPNRRNLNDYFRQIRAALLSGSARVTVYVIDIDHFKLYNDSNGHLAGDECLTALGHVFLELAAATGLRIYRFGGEEFIAVGTDAGFDSSVMGEKIVRCVFNANLPYKQSELGRVTVSVGGCDSASLPLCSDVDLLNYADIALYKAKEQGRNRFVPYHLVKSPEILP